VLGQTGRQVSVVMLNGDVFDVRAIERIGRGQVVGMLVVGDDLRRHREQALEMSDALTERGQRGVVVEIPDVVTDPGSGAFGHAEGVLLLGSAGQQRPRRGHRQLEVAGDVAARAAQ
jgi:hypothetical protein